ncbi:MAG: ABC transporter permease [Dissulfurimicrobium sp.]|uniref:ABC transporter permease n=2 Tax=Deltaproteobacteria incertae sedis TaxID=45456 RepID=UPI001EDB62C4|nr:ABC transporter permease [Dissulfurimicrobium hydrothermale]UKL13221.1 ABC transporter permease [Dissulfurimicrobium hydrothermale]
MIGVVPSLKIAFDALMTNKMRSVLTMLGIIIGVAAVIVMLALGNGARMMLDEQIKSIGSNLLIVLPGASTASGVRMGSGTQLTLTLSDAEAIKKQCPAVLYVAPVDSGVAQVMYGNQNWSTLVTGTTPSMFDLRDWPIASGRYFTQDDVKAAAKVCLLGKTVVDNLFGAINPIGQIIRIKNVPFTVIGVLAEKGQSPNGQDQDDAIYVPVTTAQKKLFGVPFPGVVKIILVSAKGANELGPAEEQITELLKQRHHIGPKQENDFTVKNLTQILKAAEKTAKIMSLLLGAIASISLVVGGIGIMNIMLVSVTERTREIGIRMAVGAKTWDIRLQFLIEAVTLSVSGGIIGIIMGMGVTLAVATTGWPTLISPISIVLAFGFSVVTGVFFGFYPAYKASLLNPIEALRHE